MTVPSFAPTLIEAFTPWHTDQNGVYAQDLIDLLQVAGEMFDPYIAYFEEQDDGTAGWGWLMDPDTSPVEALPWLAQWVGERLPPGLDEAAQRQWIKDAPNQIRGTRTSIAKATQRKLTGAKTVALHPRSRLDGTADPDRLTVMTLDSETPDPNGVKADVLSVLPWDLVLDYSHPSIETWAGVASTFTTWTNVAAAGTWADIAAYVGLPSSAGWYVYTKDSWS